MVDDRLVTMQIWDTAGQVSESSCNILGLIIIFQGKGGEYLFKLEMTKSVVIKSHNIVTGALSILGRCFLPRSRLLCFDL